MAIALNEELTGKFEFTYKEGKPFLKVLDPSIKRIIPLRSALLLLQPAFNSATANTSVAIKQRKVAIVFNANENAFPFFSIDVVQGDFDEEAEKFIGRVEKLDLAKFINTDLFSESDKLLIQQARKLQQVEINKYLNRNSPFSGFWENIIHNENEELPEETKMLIIEFLYPKLKKIIAETNVILYLPHGKKFNTDNLQPIDVLATISFPAV